MNKCTRVVDIDEICGNHGNFVINRAGVDIYFDFRPSADISAETLIIGFHGAVDRKSRSYPSFISPLPGVEGVAHQLLICDPSLRCSDDISMCWYAGDSLFHSQSILPSLFKEISNLIKVNRVIYFGTSGGGFAALFYSRLHTGSLAIVGNPQTSISRYYKRHVDEYIKQCWPLVGSISDIEDVITTDLSRIYSGRGVDNYVLYLQNSTDIFHMFGHMAPFLSRIDSGVSQLRISVECSFPGVMGHNPVWDMISVWIKSALISKDWSAKNISHAHYILKNSFIPSDSSKNPQAKVDGFDQGDILISNLLRQFQLENTRRS